MHFNINEQKTDKSQINQMLINYENVGGNDLKILIELNDKMKRATLLRIRRPHCVRPICRDGWQRDLVGPMPAGAKWRAQVLADLQGRAGDLRKGRPKDREGQREGGTGKAYLPDLYCPTETGTRRRRAIHPVTTVELQTYGPSVRKGQWFGLVPQRLW